MLIIVIMQIFYDSNVDYYVCNGGANNYVAYIKA